MLIGWVPLAVLAAAQGRALSADRAGSWLLDFGVHARSLIAAPLFILAESVCLPRLGNTVRHFLDAGLVTEMDRPRFDAIVTSTQRLRGWSRTHYYRYLKSQTRGSSSAVAQIASASDNGGTGGVW